jgi:hypothetical protein
MPRVSPFALMTGRWRARWALAGVVVTSTSLLFNARPELSDNTCRGEQAFISVVAARARGRVADQPDGSQRLQDPGLIWFVSVFGENRHRPGKVRQPR